MAHPAGVARSSVRVLIADSSRIGSLSLAGVLKRDFEIMYAGANGEEALAAVARHTVDVALLSDVLDRVEGRGYELASQIKAVNPATQVVMLVEKSDQDAVVRAFRAGARGVFSRDNHSLAALSKCVERVQQGQVWATNEEVLHLLQALVTPAQVKILSVTGAELLAPREQEVVHWVAEGLTNREIAEKMNLSENTVKNYLFRIFDKLGISKRIELALYASSQSATRAPEPPSTNPTGGASDNAALFRWCESVASRIAFLPSALADFHRDGEVVAPDPTSAFMWLLIGEQLSLDLPTRAREARLQLQAQLTNEQIAAANAKAREWLRKRPVSPSYGSSDGLRKVI